MARVDNSNLYRKKGDCVFVIPLYSGIKNCQIKEWKAAKP